MADLRLDTTRLVMTFLTDEEKKVSLTVDDPRGNVTEANIKDVMDLIVEKDVFAPRAEKLVSKVEAKVVVTDTQSYDLV